MGQRQDAGSQLPQTRREKAAEARLMARLKRSARETRIIDKLNRGMSVAELAASERVTLRRVQILLRDILAKRAPSPPVEYISLQVSRLNEPMIVAYSSMAGGNLKAVDRVVRIVGKMDRYHGFFPRRTKAPGDRRRLSPRAQEPPAIAAPPEVGRNRKVAATD